MIQLSASKLGILKECERCFWDANNSKFFRPRGIFSSLPGGIDLVLKEYFNKFRGTLPPELTGKVDGVLMSDLHTLNKWRSWRTGLTWEDAALGVKLIGALDDCLVDYPYTKDPKAEIYMPLDNKNKGSNPKDNGAQYYQLQLDCYGLLLQTNGYKTNNKAFLAYYYPLTTQLENVNPGETALRFGITTFCLESSPY